MNDDSVSAIIPCFNAAKYLQQTIESVLAQSRPVHEIVVVDDGSTDDSAMIAESFGDNVRLIRQENQGESYARNHGIDVAQSTWVAFLDADDVWEPQKLERQLEVVDDSVIASHTNYYNFGVKSGICDQSDVTDEVRYSPQYIARHTPMNIITLMVRREIQVRFPTWTKYSEDRIYQLELSRHGKTVFLPEALSGYRRHDESQSRSNPRIDILWYETLDQWLRNHASHLDEIQIEEIRNGMISELVEAGWKAKWGRDWERLQQIRDFLGPHQTHPEVAELIQHRVYPQLVYRFKDAISSVLLPRS